MVTLLKYMHIQWVTMFSSLFISLLQYNKTTKLMITCLNQDKFLSKVNIKEVSKIPNVVIGDH